MVWRFLYRFGMNRAGEILGEFATAVLGNKSLAVSASIRNVLAMLSGNNLGQTAQAYAEI